MYSKQFVDLVKDLYSSYGSYGKVAKIVNKPKITISRIIRRDPNAPQKKRGPLSIITNRDNSIIKRTIRDCNQKLEKITARKVKDRCQLDQASIRTVQRHLKKIGFQPKKVSTDIRLSKFHKLRRVACAKEWIRQNIDWSKVIFSDEKKFNLDGPDSWSSYTDENRKIYRDKRQNFQHGIMVWGMITFDGLLYLMEIEGKIKADTYCHLILDNAMPILADAMQDDKAYFQQDNATIHNSAYTSSYLRDNNIRVLSWPARSPDLNLIEEVWSWISRYVYDEKCQYNNRQELWEAIDRAAIRINMERSDHIKNLYKSELERIIKVIERKGEKLSY